MSRLSFGVRKLSAVSFVVLLILTLSANQAIAASVIVRVNFEGIDQMTWAPLPKYKGEYVDSEGGHLYLLSNPNSDPAINKQTAVDGSQSMCESLIVAGTHNSNNDRTEVQIGGDYGSEIKVNTVHNEYWYSLNVRPDPGLMLNPIDPGHNNPATDTVFQIHNVQIPALPTPPMELRSTGRQWSFVVRGSSDPAAGYNQGQESFSLGPVHPGEWTNFVLDVKFNTNRTGWLRIWENGTLMFNKQVANTSPDGSSSSKGSFVKFGVYSWWLTEPSIQQAALAQGNVTRDYCHDRIQVAGDDGSCQLVAPAGITCDAIPPTFGYQWNGTTPIKAGPPDTHAAPAYYPVIGVQANDEIEGYPPANAVDDNLSSYWSSGLSGAYLQLDLGSVKPVSRVHIAWLHGDTRQETFQIMVGDGATATYLPRMTSSGTTAGLETYSIPTHNARYVRVYGYGNTANAYNSIAELKVSG